LQTEITACENSYYLISLGIEMSDPGRPIKSSEEDAKAKLLRNWLSVCVLFCYQREKAGKNWQRSLSVFSRRDVHGKMIMLQKDCIALAFSWHKRTNEMPLGDLLLFSTCNYFVMLSAARAPPTLANC
jgi:hypothetical protein